MVEFIYHVPNRKKQMVKNSFNIKYLPIQQFPINYPQHNNKKTKLKRELIKKITISKKTMQHIQNPQKYIQHTQIQKSPISRQQSQQTQKHNPQQKQQIYLRRIHPNQKPTDSILKPPYQNPPNYQNPLQKQLLTIKKQLLRSFLRTQQDRQQPIDKFVKIVWILKGKFLYDPRIHDIMINPKKFIQKLTSQQLHKMLPLAQGQLLFQQYQKSQQQQYWVNLIGLIKYYISKTNQQNNKLQPQYEQQIKQIISKQLPKVLKLQKQILMILKTQIFSANQQYWKQVLQHIRVRRMQLILHKFYLKYKQQNSDKIQQSIDNISQEINKQPISPTLVPFSSVNPKLITQQDKQRDTMKKLAQKIFKQQFQKGRQRLQINLSLPHNHGLLSTEIITGQTNTFDQITKQIIQFQKYKRMQQDQQQFNDWVPCETEGRFRQMKPIYINRVRVSCQWNKYNSLHYTQDNPPPKTIQGYKFNIFYPDLYDQQKTPQYYLENTDDPNYCVIKFKAGPPYKDIAFKILKKQWDFTQKSGFQSIFAKGILHLYFNFKKPRYRI